jgi:hypothetical protein
MQGVWTEMIFQSKKRGEIAFRPTRSHEILFLLPHHHDLPTCHAGVRGLDGVEIRAGCNGIALVVAGVPVGGLRSAGHRAVQQGADERSFYIIDPKLDVIAHGQLEIQRNGARGVPA